ncbi:hypothetical protein HDU97_000658 [Phlyctochytrium planicorne]|nr:hypothetical protein HDU97_000658 [Phlyctochytrium planicorne]
MELQNRKRRSAGSGLSVGSGVPSARGGPGRAGSDIGGAGGPSAASTAASARKKRERKGTVAAMYPTPAVALHESAKVVEAAAHMAAKRVDAVLIVDSMGHLSGILTDKDLTFRVVAEGLDPRTTSVVDVMTHNPVSVVDTGAAVDALNKMVAGHFRHLPVIEDTPPDDPTAGGVVAVLDITKCLYDALEKLDRLYESTHHALHPPSSSSSSRYASLLMNHLSSPALSTLLQQDQTPPVVSVGDTVVEAARRMREGRETACLVFEGGEEGLGDLAGIFTSKDVVLRVLAAGLEPAATTVVRVMTPHPDCVTPETPVIDALRKMHAGRYLHLPVVDSSGVVEGLVDVLKLTYTTLGQLTNLQNDNTVENGSQLWNRFWESPSSSVGASQVGSDDNDSELSAQQGGSRAGGTNPRRRSSNSGRPTSGLRQVSTGESNAMIGRNIMTSPSPSNESMPDDSTVLPEDSASRVAENMPRRGGSTVGSRVGGAGGGRYPNMLNQTMTSPARPGSYVGVDDAVPTFTFKLRDMDTSKIHRLTFPSYPELPTLNVLTSAILARLGPQHPRFPSPPMTHASLSYIDDEGDTVHLATDEDLREAVAMAQGLGWSRLMLCLDAQIVGVGVGRFLGGGGGSMVSWGRAESDVGSGGYPSSTHLPSLAGSVRGPGSVAGDVGAGAVVGNNGGNGKRRSMDGDGMLGPVLIGTGIAVVCAFLLGRAFR